jgi:hypothetical protein
MEEILTENTECEQTIISDVENAPSEDVSETEREQADDVGEMLAHELSELKETFPELAGVSDITEIKNPLRYASLRDLGLTPTEAYLAARGPVRSKDNRSHLSASVPRVTGRGASMPAEELERAREIFYGMSDSEIQRLWKRVTK